MPGPTPLPVRLTDKQRAELLLLREDDNSRLRARATIIMACAEGLSNNEVAGRENTTPATVARWRRAFCGDGCRGLRDAPRAGRPRVGVELSDDEREALLRYQRRATVSQSLAARARIVMLCAQGHTDTEVAKIVVGADEVSSVIVIASAYPLSMARDEVLQACLSLNSRPGCLESRSQQTRFAGSSRNQQLTLSISLAHPCAKTSAHDGH